MANDNILEKKKYRFSRYYVIQNDYLFTTSNSNFDDLLKNCYIIKIKGSSVEPKIYLDIKKDNNILVKNQYIGNCKSLMNFVEKNRNHFIVIKGFNRASMSEFLKLINNEKHLNIKPVKFKSKLAEAKYERHLLTKEQRLEELSDKIDSTNKITSAEQFMKISNAVFGKRRHNSRTKILGLKNK